MSLQSASRAFYLKGLIGCHSRAFEVTVELSARIVLGERNVPSHDAVRSKVTVRSD
jgi:hypothetical protein